MSLTNESQLLDRNFAALSAQKPLFVNFSGDDFISQYQARYPQAIISCYNTHFEHYQQLKNSAITASRQFGAEYKSAHQHDLIILHFPKSKAELSFTLAMLQTYASADASIFVVGENKSGINTLAKQAKNYFSSSTKIDSARHCSLFCCHYSESDQAFNLDDWYLSYDLNIEGVSLTIYSLPGVFSQKSLDKGTKLLLAHLPEKMSGKVLDFGCGAGVISAVIGKKFPDTRLNLLDVNALAIASATKTLAANQLSGNVIASNSLSELTGTFEHVVSNPPFHQGVKTNYVATETFLTEIKRHIAPRGNITVVANSFLRYQAIMDKAIGNTVKLANETGFTIYRCNLSAK